MGSEMCIRDRKSKMAKGLHKQLTPNTSFADTMPNWHGQVELDGGRKILDTKRFMRCNDIGGSIPEQKTSVTKQERDFA